MENHLEALKEKRELLEGAYFSLEEATRDIRDLGDEIVYDDVRLGKINERIYEINTYKKKYGGSVEEVLAYHKKLKEKYDELINAEEILNELTEKESQILSDMKNVGEKLHEIRQKYSPSLEEKILRELSYVGLDKSRMKIEITLEDNYNERGFDDVSFMISTNPGEPLKPLERVLSGGELSRIMLALKCVFADKDEISTFDDVSFMISTNPGEPLKPLERVLSGGELSRIMLALKCVFADKDEISTLIFDEIDTGISGSVGQRVGEKMYQVSLGHQVLCITHLPQIAILSDHHYFVSKEVVNDKTFTRIRMLSIEDKINQVASMMGGNGVTEATIQNVKEMLKFAESKKDEIKNL